jgi:hypothetical protein
VLELRQRRWRFRLYSAAMSMNSAYIAAMWEHPSLCVALFGVQFHTPQGQQRYEAAGINEQMAQALETAQKQGLLLQTG